MIRPIMCLAMLGPAACEGGLAALWMAPPKPVARTLPTLHPVSGRLGVVVSPARPQQVALAPNERVNVLQSVKLGEEAWLVRVSVAPASAPKQPQETAFGGIARERLLTMLSEAPSAVVGLRLDSSLLVLEDQRGLSRRGRVIRCDGEPVTSSLALRACLVLARGGVPKLEFELVVSETPAVTDAPTTPALADRLVRADAGPPVDGGEEAP